MWVSFKSTGSGSSFFFKTSFELAASSQTITQNRLSCSDSGSGVTAAQNSFVVLTERQRIDMVYRLSQNTDVFKTVPDKVVAEPYSFGELHMSILMFSLLLCCCGTCTCFSLVCAPDEKRLV
jgi:hypothetical protein